MDILDVPAECVRWHLCRSSLTNDRLPEKVIVGNFLVDHNLDELAPYFKGGSGMNWVDVVTKGWVGRNETKGGGRWES